MGDFTREEIEMICAQLPDEPICDQLKPEPTTTDSGATETAGGRMTHGPHDMLNPMEGQITFAIVAVASAVGYALDMFKWRADVNNVSYYAPGDAAWNNGTNWWKIYNMLGCYTGLILWSVAAITQLLSMGGIAADINLMVWGYGLGGVGGLVSLIVSLLAFYAKWSSFTITNDSTKSSAEISGANVVY